MGLPIWNSPPPSPRPATAQLYEGGGSIRRRSSSRTSPRDQAHRFDRSLAASRISRPSSHANQRARTAADNAALSLSTVNALLNELHQGALALRNSQRDLPRLDGADELPSASNSPARSANAAIGSAYARQELEERRRAHEEFDRERRRYSTRLTRTRLDIQRLQDGGMNMLEQRSRLNELSQDFYQRFVRFEEPYDGGGIRSRRDLPDREVEAERASSRALPQRSERAASDHAQPMLPYFGGYTLSPQPLPESMSAGAVRPAFTGRTELPPPFRRIRDQMIANANAESIDGLGDRLRSPSADLATEDWAPMLSDIRPDERLPSAASSFATTAAGLSFSDSRDSNDLSRAPSASTGPNSARTSITVPDDSGCDTEEIWRLIGDRLNNGEDIPDEMWENAGVPHAVARSLATRTTRERL